MKGYNIARVPEHIWDLPGEGQRVRGADFNVAAWIRVDSFGDSEVMADEVVLLVQHEDEAGVHRAVADRAHISEGGSALMAGLIHLRFTGEVRNVRVRNIDMGRKDQILNLLTVASTDKAIALHFSDGGVIRLEVSAIRCHLEDLGEPWPTSSRPHHPLDESGPEQG